MKIVVSDGPRDHIGDQYGDGELPQQQSYDVGVPSAKDLPDADLFGAALGSEGGEAKQPKTGDEDGNPDEEAEHLTLSFVGFELALEAVVQEESLKGGSRNE